MPEKILIVDDDIDSLKLIGLMLQRHGYEVVAASEGIQALSKAAGEKPDLIILDVMMPGMDGYEVCRRLRANPETVGIPIIMFTAKTLIDDKVAGFEAGADDYLTKPTHPAELASRVKAILSRSQPPRPQTQEPERGTTIGVMGAKGGVGTTTVAVNMAAALTMNGASPIVADFRLGSGSLGLILGHGRSTGMATVLSRPANEIRPPAVDKELVVHQSGLRALVSSARPKEAQLNVAVDSAVAVVRCLRTMGNPIIFDLGAGFTPLVSRLQRDMDQLLVIVEPVGVTLAMARELLGEIEASGVGMGRVHVVVVNRAQSSLQTPWQEVEQALGQEIRAIISSAPELAFQSSEAATPLVMFQPNAIVSSQIIKLTEDVSTRKGRVPKPA